MISLAFFSIWLARSSIFPSSMTWKSVVFGCFAQMEHRSCIFLTNRILLCRQLESTLEIGFG